MKKNIKNASIFLSFIFGLTLTFQAHAAGKIIVNVTEARVRISADPNAKVQGSTKLGTVYDILAQKNGWYNINYKEKTSGWISATIIEPFDESRRLEIYQKLANKYINRPNLDFESSSELFGFLTNIQSEVVNSNAEPILAFNRLVALALTLETIPFEKIDKPPYKTFTEANKRDVVYSEPAGQYLVNTKRFWDLREKFSKLPIADEIAWKGSQIDLPGECEGYIVCYLFSLRETTAKYLEFYPTGVHNKESIQKVAEILESLAKGVDAEDSGYYITSEPDDRTQLKSHVSALRNIVSKTSGSLKSKIMGYLDKIESGYQPKNDDNATDAELLDFWTRLKAAVIKKDKNAVANMTRFPFAMPFGQKPIKTKAEFLKRYDAVFNGETNAAKCFEKAKLSKDGVFCGFKNALESKNKPILYYFEKTKTGWKLVGLDNINE